MRNIRFSPQLKKKDLKKPICFAVLKIKDIPIRKAKEIPFSNYHNMKDKSL